ncbi:hypothetical protein PMAYCL1PPCAC_06647, partial [Pristionchus mayeri]
MDGSTPSLFILSRTASSWIPILTILKYFVYLGSSFITIRPSFTPTSSTLVSSSVPSFSSRVSSTSFFSSATVFFSSAVTVSLFFSPSSIDTPCSCNPFSFSSLLIPPHLSLDESQLHFCLVQSHLSPNESFFSFLRHFPQPFTHPHYHSIHNCHQTTSIECSHLIQTDIRSDEREIRLCHSSLL